MLISQTDLELRFKNVSKSKVFNNLKENFGLQNKTVLDIGCSNGEFLAHFGKGSVGLTVNQGEVENGRKMHVDVRMGNIEEDDFSNEFNGKFDIIFANNIFEHMLAPHLFLVKIKKYLKESGIVIIGVPVVPYVFPLIYLNKFSYALSSAHVNFFTRYTFHKTVEYAGFNISRNSGFYFTNKILDFLFNFVCPHFYIVATSKKDFKYDDKRMTELAGYKKTNIIQN